MSHAYRAFEVGEDGHVINRLDLIYCFNDYQAMQRAKQLADGRTIELWDGACLLARFEQRQ